MAWTAQRYAGASQLPPYQRWSFLLGPILMSFSGAWNNTADALMLPPALDPSSPAAWLAPAADGNALHFTVPAAPGVTVRPYFEIQDPPAPGAYFTNYPCFLV